ncbi:MAG: thioredoxin family protein, partial [Candidatus Delongbacteria bacterium]|nr:thioredoxin family protein [Candidatus Delongbacteria bacterium]
KELKMKIFWIMLLSLLTNEVLSISWVSSIDSGIDKAKRQEAPLLIYFYAENHQPCNEFEAFLNEGLLDFLSENFILVKINVMNENNENLIKNYSVSEIPLFVLEDFNPERKAKIQPVIIKPVNIIRGLYELYANASDGFISSKEYDSAYGSLKLLENFPSNLGQNVKTKITELEPKVKIKTSVKKKDDNKFKAESYMKTAESNLKNKKYEKAYLYFEKVIELVPNTELAKNAYKEKNKIKDLIDKSVILK